MKVSERIELMRQISAREFLDYKVQQVPGSIAIQKKVVSFQCDGMFTIEEIINGPNQCLILRLESDQQVTLNDLP